MSEAKPNLEGVAIVGMAGRFPGARSVEEFWNNQLNGVESISHFDVEELEVPNAAELAKDPNYVRARSILNDADLFDAEFFGIHPREAELTDPQHRLFLESCWQALEDAGYDPAAYAGEIGVYAGCSPATYFLSRVCARPGFVDKFTGAYQVGNYQEMLGSSVDFLATRVSYKLNLRGPSFTMQAGCSTSLLAATQACQALLTYQCDMALAGGSSITFPQKRGSFYQDGGMTSPDGHCRTFDANAQGTVFGSGVAVVLLKRLEDALRDGDQIYAVIKGFAVNNDGSAKVGYTAPSVEGQARVIALAQAAAGVSPDTIGYLEAHGTATPLGDPIELAAATQAFRVQTNAKGFCAIGTAKTNVGHLDIASGVTGLIHAAQIVQHGIFPPTLHFERANPKFDLENTPFYVNKQQAEWKNRNQPRRAGVSSFGVGGTNAHVVIEQAPEQASPPTARSIELLVLSARTEAALDRATENLAEHLKRHPDIDFEDVAWTLQVGRRVFPCRRTVVARDVNDALAALTSRDRNRVQTRTRPLQTPEISFLFPGQGSQHPNMGREIYETEPVFREAVDRCSEILRPILGADLKELLYPAADVSDEDRRRVTETILAQPAIFTIEYALAQLWMSWGIHPKTMLGHSIGEFVAACLAGVFSLEDALRLVATRGEMMQKLPAGGMLSVRLPETDLRGRLNGRLSLAAINSPALCVVSGPFEALESFEAQLGKEGIASRRLVTSHAFHSAMMDPITQPFATACAQANLNAPERPYVSSVTGTWITADQATDPVYWARHFREPVQFSAGVKLLRSNPNAALLEVGPGNVLTALARQHSGFSSEQVIVPSLADGFSGANDSIALMNALSALWSADVQPNWAALYHGVQRRRVSLPTYPFERKRYWIDLPQDAQNVSNAGSTRNQQQTSAVAVPLNATEDATPVNATTQAEVSTSSNRISQITKSLAEIFEDLSGTDISSADPATTFLEMGFDSLFLTQVTQTLQSKFGLKITFRQLLGEQSSVGALAQYLDANLPADKFAEAAPIPMAPAAAPTLSQTPSPFAAAADSNPAPAFAANSVAATGRGAGQQSALERTMHEQIRAMNELFAKQLDALKGVSPQVQATGSPAMPQPALQQPAKGPSKQPAISAEVSAAKPATTLHINKDTKELKGYTPFKPLQKGSSSNLTSKQRDYVASLIERYAQRTAGSKQKTQEYRQPLADPRVVSGFRSEWKEMVYPIVTVRSKGSHLWDVDGNEYVDLLNGFGPIMLGHRPDFVEKAIEKQLHEGFEIGPQTLLAGEVAKMICEFTGNERATFCNTGSEAVISAMRVARTVTGRSKVVFFAGDYHGMFDEVLVKGIRRAGVPHAIPVAPGIPREKAANVVVLDYGAAESLEWIRANANDLAAVMVEPVQSRHPALQPVDFLRELRKITEASDTCLIFDEVVTGFRVHPGGCQALFDIRADLATYGKVLAGGMPIGVLAGKSRYMDALDGGAWQFGDDSYPAAGVTFFAGTFVRHPLTLAAAKAVLEHLKEQGPELQERLSEKTRGLVERLNEVLAKYGVPTHIENFASIFYFSFASDFHFGCLFYYHLREKGIHLLEGFPCSLTTTHSDADLDRVVRAFEESAAEMRAGGMLPAQSETENAPQTTNEAEPLFIPSAPMTEPQLEVWLSDQLSEDASCSYNESFMLRLRGTLNESALKEAIQRVIARHDALRSSFDGEARRVHFARELKIEIPTVDLTALSSSERDARVREIIQQDARTPFRLAEAPLVRTQLIKLEPGHTLLIFTSHHIVCDGWSTNVLLDEMSVIYNSLGRGTTYELSRAMSFADYAAAQADFSGGDEGQKIEKFWVEQFKQLPPPLDLPTDRPRAAVKEFKGATYRHRIGPALYADVKKLGARQKCTLFVTLLSTLQILLSRLSGQDDIVVGIPTAGQSLVDDVLVGHCVNFIPLRSGVRADASAAEFLSQVKQCVLEGYEHQNYTYGRLVRKLALQRDPSRLPLTEIQFNLEKVGEGLRFDGLEAEVDPNPKSFVNFDLFLNIVESKDGLALDCDFNTGLFDEATVARWISHYETLLRSMIADANQPVGDLPLLTDAECKQLIVDWNATEAECPRGKCVQQLINEQASRAPENVAVTVGAERVTYSEMVSRANRLANYLVKLGVKPGSLVGVSTERTADMLVALLATWKAGAAYVPLDPTYPRERLSYILDQTKVSALLTHATLLEQLPICDGALVCLDKDDMLIEREPETAPAIAHDALSLAYVIFTSGSTGKPKGVEVTHENVVNLLWSMRSKPGFTERDRLLAVTTLSFDIAALELFLPLVCGGSIILVNRETATHGGLLLQALSQFQPTVMQGTPATWRLLLEAGWSGTPGMKMLCGGEALSRDLANRLVNCGELWNMYGPTETTIWSATCRVERADGPVPFGGPLANTQFYVLDSRRGPVPIGVPGELYIGGAGVARGYFNRPDLTAERFVPDPFARSADQRMFKTGDLVRYRTDGLLDFLGRLDNQVKVRGFRIELGEIEAALTGHPNVRECVVVAREDEPGLTRLIAYVVSQSDENPPIADLRDWIGRSLPMYMLPSLVVFVEQLPRTPNGKVDRKSLAARETMNSFKQPFVAPGSATEKELVRICAEVLKTDQISVDANIFHLGADSIHLFQIVARAQRAGMAVSPRDLMTFQTIRDLAEQLDRRVNGHSNGDSAEIPRAPREQYRLPATSRRA
jgi:amino acid adenylation domain-containing protein